MKPNNFDDQLEEMNKRYEEKLHIFCDDDYSAVVTAAVSTLLAIFLIILAILGMIMCIIKGNL